MLAPKGCPAVFVIVVLFLGAGQGAAQILVDDSEALSFSRPEAWAMKRTAALTLFTGFGVPREERRGSFAIGFEAATVPSLTAPERTVGFFGTKEEDLNKTSWLARPRVQIGLPRAVSLEASYLPPVEAFGVTPDLLALAVGRPVFRSGAKRLGLRLAAQAGSLESDFTCPRSVVAAGENRRLNPFGCEEPSRDVLRIRSLTFETSAAVVRRRMEPYASLAMTWVDLEFEIDARYSGRIDTTRLTTDGSFASASLGLRLERGKRTGARFELFYAPLNVARARGEATKSEELVNARLLVIHKLR